MSKLEAWIVHLANIAVGVTGLIYGWMLYLVEPENEFDLVNHPLQPELQSSHVLTAPLLVFAIGLIWTNHVWDKVTEGDREGRLTGWTLILMLLPMILSGYMLQVSADPDWRVIWQWTHGLTGSLWIVATIVHQIQAVLHKRG